MRELIRVGIIGTGKHGSRYANHVVEDLGGKLQLTAISRRSPDGKKQAQSWGVEYFQDYRDLITCKDVDAVISVTPPNINLDIASLCVAEKKPLLIEKPLTTSFSSAKQIVEIFEKNSLGLTVGQTLRFNSVVNSLRSELAQMGKLYSFSACHRLEPSSLSWLEEPEVAGGGVIFHTAVHLFDALRYITGLEVKRIRASAVNIYNLNLEDLAVAEILFSNGAMGVVDVSKVSPARAGRFEFMAEKGQLQGDQIYGTVQKIEGMTPFAVPVQPLGPTIQPLLNSWYDFLIGRGENPIPGTEGLAAVQICDACRQAVETGGWVDL